MIDLQDGRCVYSGIELTQFGINHQLDHVVPWSRIKISSLENFIVTTAVLNGAKSDSLPSPTNVGRWLQHTSDKASEFKIIANEFGWPSDIQRVHSGLARLYEVSAPGTPVWDGESMFGLDEIIRSEALSLLK